MSVEQVYTTREVAQIERIAESSVAEACKAGRFPGAYLVSRRAGWRIPESAVLAWRQSMVQGVPAVAAVIEPYSARSKKRRSRI